MLVLMFALALVDLVIATDVNCELASAKIFAFSDVYNIDAYGRFNSMRSNIKDPYISVLSGDFLSPSNYSTIDHGVALMTAARLAEVDIISPGNHEFDLPIDSVNSRFEENDHAVLVASNLVGLRNSVPFHITELGGISIGFIGLVTEHFTSDHKGDIILEDPVAAATRAIDNIPPVDVLVAMTHQDVSADLTLLDLVPEIDLILGGHIHEASILHHNGVWVARSGEELQQVVEVKLSCLKCVGGGDVSDVVTKPKVDIEVGLVPLAGYPIDPAIAAVRHSADQLLKKSFATPLFALNHTLSTYNMRQMSSNAGTFFSNIIAAHFKADVCLLNGGLFRTKDTYSGIFTYGDLSNIFPMNNLFTTTVLTGAEVIQALHLSHTNRESPGGYLHHNDLMFAIETDKTYSVALNVWLLYGMDDNTILMSAPKTGTVHDGTPVKNIICAFSGRCGE